MVSAIGLGCMSFGGTFGPTTPEASHRCLDAAYDHGLTHLDTANIYGMGLSESILGTWSGLHKPNISIATKAGIINGLPRRFDNSESYLRAELESSLKRLGVDHVDLFYIHRRDDSIPIEEVVGSLTRMIEDGLIGGYGLSEISPGTLRRAHAVHPCRAVQNEYSLWSRQPDLGLIQTCAELGVAFVAFSPLGRGVFGREIVDPATLPATDFRLQIPRFQNPDWSLNQTRLHAFRTFAKDIGQTPSALALAWVLDQGPHLIPIPGTRSADHLMDWITASDVTFTDDIRTTLAQILPTGWAYGDRYNLAQASTVERYC